MGARDWKVLASARQFLDDEAVESDASASVAESSSLSPPDSRTPLSSAENSSAEETGGKKEGEKEKSAEKVLRELQKGPSREALRERRRERETKWRQHRADRHTALIERLESKAKDTKSGGELEVLNEEELRSLEIDKAVDRDMTAIFPELSVSEDDASDAVTSSLEDFIVDSTDDDASNSDDNDVDGDEEGVESDGERRVVDVLGKLSLDADAATIEAELKKAGKAAQKVAMSSQRQSKQKNIFGSSDEESLERNPPQLFDVADDTVDEERAAEDVGCESQEPKHDSVPVSCQYIPCEEKSSANQNQASDAECAMCNNQVFKLGELVEAAEIVRGGSMTAEFPFGLTAEFVPHELLDEDASTGTSPAGTFGDDFDKKIITKSLRHGNHLVRLRMKVLETTQRLQINSGVEIEVPVKRVLHVTDILRLPRNCVPGASASEPLHPLLDAKLSDTESLGSQDTFTDVDGEGVGDGRKADLDEYEEDDGFIVFDDEEGGEGGNEAEERKERKGRKRREGRKQKTLSPRRGGEQQGRRNGERGERVKTEGKPVGKGITYPLLVHSKLYRLRSFRNSNSLRRRYEPVRLLRLARSAGARYVF